MAEKQLKIKRAYKRAQELRKKKRKYNAAKTIQRLFNRTKVSNKGNAARLARRVAAVSSVEAHKKITSVIVPHCRAYLKRKDVRMKVGA